MQFFLFENSTQGIVTDIYDLLTEYELSIVGEQIIRPEHVLLGLPDAELEDIRQVCSHPQALSSVEISGISSGLEEERDGKYCRFCQEDKRRQ